MKKAMLNLVLYGNNGHQLSEKQIEDTPGVTLYGVCGAEAGAAVKRFASLKEIARDGKAELVSVCSPVRARQGEEILALVRAGKHVYAEKPLASDNGTLCKILAAAHERGVFVGEMCGTAFEEPYRTVKKLVSEGEIGKIVQVYMQKSYPYADWRPQDEREDGGLIRQNAIHALRVLVHTLSLTEAEKMYAVQTNAGNPHAARQKGGGLRTAASLLISFRGGAIAAVNANYLNPQGTGVWGNERLIVFGTKGSIETDTPARTVKLSTEKGVRFLPWGEREDYFCKVIGYLNGENGRPLPEELEFLPTKMANSLREKAEEAL